MNAYFLFNEVIFTVFRLYTIQDDGYVRKLIFFVAWSELLAFSYFVVSLKKIIVGRYIEDKTRGSFLSSGKSVISVGNAYLHYSSTSGFLNSLPNVGTDGYY